MAIVYSFDCTYYWHLNVYLWHVKLLWKHVKLLWKHVKFPGTCEMLGHVTLTHAGQTLSPSHDVICLKKNVPTLLMTGKTQNLLPSWLTCCNTDVALSCLYLISLIPWLLFIDFVSQRISHFSTFTLISPLPNTIYDSPPSHLKVEIISHIFVAPSPFS